LDDTTGVVIGDCMDYYFWMRNKC